MGEDAEVERQLVDDVSEALRIAADHLDLPFGIVSRIEDDRYLVEHVVAPADAGLHRGRQFELGHTYCAITLDADGIVTIDEMGRSEHRGHPAYTALGLESYIGIPIRLDGARFGTLNFSGPERRSHDYGRAERGLVKLVASWVERTLDRGRLLRELTEIARHDEVHAAQYASIVEGIQDGIVVHRGGRVLEVNSRLSSLLGYGEPEAMIGEPLIKFVPLPEHRAEVASRLELLARGEVPGTPSQIVIETISGERRHVETVGVPVRRLDGPAALTMVRDVTDRRLAEKRLMQAERLASVGSLAAGVAHELNNPLAYVIANLEVVSEDLAEIMGGSPSKRLRHLREAVDEARQGAERARRIVRDLKTFSRVEDEVRAPHDVRRLLDIAINMTRNELRHRATLLREYQEVPPVSADEARLTQVFVNLLMNAAQAIPEGAADRHQVRIVTRQADGSVFVEVSDTGAGIDPHVLPRIFDPFFTTKPSGEGTGLGLSLSYNIVHALGGDLSARNQSDGGACMIVRLPSAAGMPVTEPPAEAKAPEAPRGRVLVIDDDPLVAKSVERVLNRAHDVTIAPSGAEALKRIVDEEQDYDVILCDLMMPTMPGWVVFERLKAHSEAVAERVIFMSGGTLGSEGRRFLDTVQNVRLEKPFEMKNLRALVASMVQARE